MEMMIQLPEDLSDDELERFRLAWRSQMLKDPLEDSRPFPQVMRTIARAAGLEWDATSPPLEPRFVRKS